MFVIRFCNKFAHTDTDFPRINIIILTYLKRLPASLIKIDQSFIRDMLTDPHDLAIVMGVVSLAKAFQLEVIAEGVKIVGHGTELLQLGCKLAQDYGISRPKPSSDILIRLDSWQPDSALLHTLTITLVS
ncbi:EAL domain-containing protein [Colwellia sp. MB02u-10]|uniref:EAL domain-containing protein n=1 Tax=Colwellia sp. MB02u-10 TaxID=2759828 RepID=UPI001C7157A8|nr:EAL domain-containing protein [Colwellia sp. MB02u-10]